jgi:sugar lactone lactonase YvrE
MMRRNTWWIALGVAVILLALFSLRAPWLAQRSGEDVIGGLSTPESVAIGPDGKYYISNLGRPGLRGDGAIKVVEDGTVKDLVTGLDDPKGVIVWEDHLYVADIDKVWRISLTGEKELLLGPEDFPRRPLFLNDIAISASGNLYISDTQLGLIFKVSTDHEVSILADRSSFPELRGPNGLVFDQEGDLLVIDFNTGKLLKIAPDGSGEVIGENFGGGDGLAFDAEGNLYISDYKGGKIFRRVPDGSVEIIAQGLKAPADIAIDLERNLLLVPEFNGDRLRLISLGD